MASLFKHPIVIISALFLFPISACGIGGFMGSGGTMLNPLQFGLNQAKTGEERYLVLQKTHKEAARLGVGVSYAGIDKIQLTIPQGAKTLPLTHYTDFAGVTFQVENKQKNMYLFSLLAELTPVTVTGKEIDGQDFSRNMVLRTGKKLLVVNDETPWVENRKGHDYGAVRKEIMLVKNGKSSNGPVQSYCTPVSKPAGFYIDVAKTPKTVFKNVTLNRTANSTFRTNLVRIDNHYDVELSNITINTPEGTGLYGDRAIYLVNCLKIVMEDVTINGTYSQTKDAAYGQKFGYGISLDNTYDYYARNIYARANWGVYGNNNVHKAHLENCDINRFDIHCYGRDISFDNCNIVDQYTSYGSVFGLISYKNCTFTDCRPVLTGDSYNTYVGYDVYFENCTFNLTKKYNSIIDFSGFNLEENSRPELKEKCLPNVTMIGCRVNVPAGVKKWYIYNTAKANGFDGRFDYISDVVIDGLTVNDDKVTLELFSGQIQTKKKVQVKKNITLSK